MKLNQRQSGGSSGARRFHAVSTLQIGVLRSKTSAGVRASNVSEYVSVHEILDASLLVFGMKRRLCCFFHQGQHVQLQFYMKDIRGNVHLETTPNGMGAITVQFGRPPRLFHNDASTTDPEARSWCRSVDPTGGIMGSCLDYRFVLDKPLDKLPGLTAMLVAFHLLDEPVQIHLSPVVTKNPALCLFHPASSYDGLSFAVRYELETLYSSGRRNGADVDVAALNALKLLSEHDALQDLRTEQRHSGLISQLHAAPRCAVTPMRILVLPSEPEDSCRISRQVPRERLLRVTFCDENHNMLFDLTEDTVGRIHSVLTNGIIIGGRTFEFLAFSSSQLKQRSCWFIAPDGVRWSSNAVRASMGDFSAMKFAGKAAARMGQCFSATSVALSLKPDEWQHIEDVEHNGFCFSDGVGTISTDLLHEVITTLGHRPATSALQIRLGGVKGMVTHDPSLPGRVLCTRPSMEKFPCSACDLEICRPATWMPGFLNRQIITLLSTLGVDDRAFEVLQTSMLARLRRMREHNADAVAMLRYIGEKKTSAVLMMLQAGISVAGDIFLAEYVRAIYHHQIQELHLRTRIVVPKSCSLVGVMDETCTLQENEVFMQIRPPHQPTVTTVSGAVVVVKNPCLHPGDMLVLKAVDRPSLRHLTNVLVFPSCGDRPQADRSSGGDLDGDDFWVCWDPTLCPAYSVPPADYRTSTVPVESDSVQQRIATAMLRELFGFESAKHVDPAAPGPPISFFQASPPTELRDTRPPQTNQHNFQSVRGDRTQEMTRFFCDFMMNDQLGRIANAHLVHADKSPLKAFDPKCVALASLHSTAVDFPKTGIPATLEASLAVPGNKYPDFMNKKGKGKTTYESDSVLGVLYRQLHHDVKVALPKPTYDARLNFGTFTDFVLDGSRKTREWYNCKLLGLMMQFGVKDEGQLISGHILKFFRRHCKSKRKFDLKQTVAKAVDALQIEARQAFEEFAVEVQRQGPDVDHATARMTVASAWYFVTYHGDAGNTAGLYSFPWLASAASLADVLALSVGESARSAPQ